MRKARAYLDGGPADGTTLELDEPDWAPLGALEVTVNHRRVTYVLAPQRDPKPGKPWRYVPEDSLRDSSSLSSGANYDPNDD